MKTKTFKHGTRHLQKTNNTTMLLVEMRDISRIKTYQLENEFE